MGDRYDAIRRPEHSTLGDAFTRFKRDSDAFTAGAQYALDNLLALSRDGLDLYDIGPHVTSCAADVLKRIHNGHL